MNLEIVCLSVVQGVSEVLPISSSVNLYFFSKLFDISSFTFGLKVALHVGSLMAFIIYFKRDIVPMFSAIFTRKNKLSDTYFWHLIIGTLPVVILGFFALDFVKEFNSKTVIGVFCAFFGGALFLFDKLSRARMSSSDKKRISIFKAFVIGCFQAISILPGVSRLGICITSARFLQIDRKRSIAFSMLLAIPTICASTVLGVIDCYKHDNFSVFSLDALIGIVVTMVIGLIIIFPCVRYMEKNGFAYLVIYRILIGLLMILL